MLLWGAQKKHKSDKHCSARSQLELSVYRLCNCTQKILFITHFWFLHRHSGLTLSCSIECSLFWERPSCFLIFFLLFISFFWFFLWQQTLFLNCKFIKDISQRVKTWWMSKVPFLLGQAWMIAVSFNFPFFFSFSSFASAVSLPFLIWFSLETFELINNNFLFLVPRF